MMQTSLEVETSCLLDRMFGEFEISLFIYTSSHSFTHSYLHTVIYTQ